MKKPFNPILGETFQGHFSGEPIYCEQISHHPPITATQIYGKDYTFSSTVIPGNQLGMNLNSIYIRENGLVKLHLKKTNNHIIARPSSYCFQGIMFGPKLMYPYGMSYMWSQDSFHISVIKYSLDISKANDHFEGYVYKVTEDVINKFEELKVYDYSEEESDEFFMGFKPINVLRGYSTHYCKIDDKKIWDIENFRHMKLFSCSRKLPSDSSNREDLNLWRLKDLSMAEEAKNELEIL